MMQLRFLAPNIEKGLVFAEVLSLGAFSLYTKEWVTSHNFTAFDGTVDENVIDSLVPYLRWQGATDITIGETPIRIMSLADVLKLVRARAIDKDVLFVMVVPQPKVEEMVRAFGEIERNEYKFTQDGRWLSVYI